SPAEKGVAFLVAREFELGVQLERVFLAEVVDLHRVIDDELDRLQRIDFGWVAAEADDAVAHGRKIDNAGHAGEVLQQHAGGHERDFLERPAPDVPLRERVDVGLLDEAAVLVAHQVLEQDLERERQPRDAGEAALLERDQTVDGNGAGGGREGRTRAETVSASQHWRKTSAGKSHRTAAVIATQETRTQSARHPYVLRPRRSSCAACRRR